MTNLRSLIPALTLGLLLANPASALDAVVIKDIAHIPNFAFQSGEVIPQLDLGYETYGRLNAAGDNAVLIPHFFLGDSHAAGRYAPGEPQGWWDELIGPGAPIDTNRFFVVCTDLPCGMLVERPSVVTTGPATIDPRTGAPYGLSFPRTTVRDHVRAQRAVLDLLGVRRLRLVVGPSLGGMVAWQWAIEFPADVDAIMPVAAPTGFDPLELAGFATSAATVRSDPAWAFGDYARYGTEPVVGVAMALYGYDALVKGRGPLLPWMWLNFISEARALDANHYLYTIDLHLNYALGSEYGSLFAALQRVRARVGLVGFRQDELVTPAELQLAHAQLQAAGIRSELTLVDGLHGHLSAIYDVPALGPAIALELSR